MSITKHIQFEDHILTPEEHSSRPRHYVGYYKDADKVYLDPKSSFKYFIVSSEDANIDYDIENAIFSAKIYRTYYDNGEFTGEITQVTGVEMMCDVTGDYTISGITTGQSFTVNCGKNETLNNRKFNCRFSLGASYILETENFGSYIPDYVQECVQQHGDITYKYFVVTDGDQNVPYDTDAITFVSSLYRTKYIGGFFTSEITKVNAPELQYAISGYSTKTGETSNHKVVFDCGKNISEEDRTYTCTMALPSGYEQELTNFGEYVPRYVQTFLQENAEVTYKYFIVAASGDEIEANVESVVYRGDIYRTKYLGDEFTNIIDMVNDKEMLYYITGDLTEEGQTYNRKITFVCGKNTGTDERVFNCEFRLLPDMTQETDNFGIYVPEYHQIYRQNVVAKEGYFYIENPNETDMTISLNGATLEWSRNGSTWSTGDIPTLGSRQKIYFKGNYKRTRPTYDPLFIVNNNFNVGGNIMSISDGDDFDIDNGVSVYQFLGLFSRTDVVDASKLELPSQYLSVHCYEALFFECQKLIKAPEVFPALNLKDYCMYETFYECTSLEHAPQILATEYAPQCFERTFMGCTSLIDTPTFYASSIPNHCFCNCFEGCTSLVTAPELPATTIDSGSYQLMFVNCTSLVNAQTVLPALEVPPHAYKRMFEGCSSLINAPEIMATKILNSLGYDTGSLTCMFSGCSSLNHIKIHITEGLDQYGQHEFTSGVASTGIFECPADANWPIDSTGGIPVGWTRKDIEEKSGYFYIENVSQESTDVSNDTTYGNISYSKDGTNWATGTITLNPGEKVYCKGNYHKVIDEEYYRSPKLFRFNNTEAQLHIGGNIMSISNGDDFEDAEMQWDGQFIRLFAGSNNIIDASNLELPYNSIRMCYYGMFDGCTSLVNAPELPATTLADSCYIYMFYGCTSLVNAPELPATTLAQQCYYSMFQGCTSLVNAPELPATTLASSCYYFMFKGCTSLVNAPELPATTLADNCYREMFFGCTSLNHIKCLATTFVYASTYNWLQGVSPTGTFETLSTTSWQYGTSGIPSGWTRVNIDE